jgi:hypothetical protein
MGLDLKYIPGQSPLFNKRVFTWGKVYLTGYNEARKAYLTAIKEADKGNIKPLVEFART